MGVECTVTVFDTELNTNGIVVPRSVATTLNVPEFAAGMLAAKVMTFEIGASVFQVIVFTTVLVAVLIRLTVNGPVPPDNITL